MKDKLSSKQRYEIYKRDGFMCALCGSGTGLQIHHAIPRGQGGSNLRYNLITLCATCHAQVHGFEPIPCPDITREDMDQLCIEYLADMYVDEWYPLE